MILLDSHCSKSKDSLKDCLDPNYKICSFIDPNAIIKSVVQDTELLVKNFRGNDWVILMRGVNKINSYNPYQLIVTQIYERISPIAFKNEPSYHIDRL